MVSSGYEIVTYIYRDSFGFWGLGVRGSLSILHSVSGDMCKKHGEAWKQECGPVSYSKWQGQC